MLIRSETLSQAKTASQIEFFGHSRKLASLRLETCAQERDLVSMVNDQRQRAFSVSFASARRWNLGTCNGLLFVSKAVFFILSLRAVDLDGRLPSFSDLNEPSSHGVCATRDAIEAEAKEEKDDTDVDHSNDDTVRESHRMMHLGTLRVH